MSFARWRRAASEHAVVIGGALLGVAYLWFYFASPDLPDNFTKGWWGWFDQGKTFESARALLVRDFDPERHWYPLGYPLLGTVFLRLGFRAHPFVLLDLGCLLGCYALFLDFARRCGLTRQSAVLAFLLAAFWDRQLFREWVIPWNSTPAAVLVWAILVLGARWLDGVRRPVQMGLLAGLVPWFRPTEAVPVAVILCWPLAADLWARRFRWGDALRLAVAASVPLILQVGLHLYIYGPRPSEYMLHSRDLGFTLHDFAWRAYVILADPYPWFTDGQGLVQRLPWAALGLAGMVAASIRGGPAGMLAAGLLAHLVLYVSYVDLLPPGLWRFNNIHYWKWALPGYALLGWLLVRNLAAWPWRRSTWPALAGACLVLGLAFIQVRPRPAAPGEQAKMLAYAGPAPAFTDSFFGEFTIADGDGPMRSPGQIRTFPVPGGMRLIGIRRGFEGEVRFESDAPFPSDLIGQPPARWSARVGLGLPCALIAALCGHHSANPLFPPAPG